jgi:hypothetical protein
VVTSGFAGGLDPRLRVGTVVYDADPGFPGLEGLAAMDAVATRFHLSERIVTSVTEKETLRRQTGADVVDMESDVIRRWSRARGLASATVRVISDGAGEDLPLDFNRLLTSDFRLRPGRLALVLAGRPGKLRELLRFHRRIRQAAGRLSEVLLSGVVRRWA